MSSNLQKPLFALGKICATPGAAALSVDLGIYLQRHNYGDWGEGLNEEDKVANEVALRNGDKLLSCFVIPRGEKLSILTNVSRTVTTVMLSNEI